jgi:long-chain acyl-CoA synthetase
MCAHRNIVATIASAMAGLSVTNKDVYIGYLPLAHILELGAENAIICSGAAIGYGTPRTLTDATAKPCGDLKAIAPTIMAGVPRVYDTIKKGIMGKISKAGGLKKKLFETAFGWKLPYTLNNETSPFFDWLVFSKFLPEVGGRLRLMISGGAPLSKETMEFIKVCFGCTIIQGYGLTETCGGCSFQDPSKFSTGNVGIPIGSNEVKLIDVLEMGYSHKDKDPRGEICIRGNNISLGYYKDQKKTDESFDKDGWFHTGDIGQWNSNGTLSIIDRKKNLVKMAHGEYVALENLESIFGNSPFVKYYLK